jgi:glycosyltransferase EpsD
MNKKLLITSTDVMMFQFLLPHAISLIKEGWSVDVACSNANGYENEGYINEIKHTLPKESQVYQISSSRNPFSWNNFKAEKELKAIIRNNKYALVWTNEPVVGVLTRLAASSARKNGCKVLYMAHGFHFFKGAPLKNWIYFPIEKIMAQFCDAIVTINSSDYAFSKKYLKKQTYKIDGIGLNLRRFANVNIDKQEKREELGVNKDDFVIVSVGELLPHKNHSIILKSIKESKISNIKYLICGTGELIDEYKHIIKENGIEDKVKLLGHRYDVPEILYVSDLFIHPSTREGFGIAIVEAMAAGLPVITSNVGGINDIVENDKNGYKCDPSDSKKFIEKIDYLANNEAIRLEFKKQNKEKAKKYSIENSFSQILEIIKTCLGEVK